MILPWDVKAVIVLVFISVLGLAGWSFHLHEVAVYDRGFKAANDARNLKDAAALKLAAAAALERERKYRSDMDAAETLRLKQKEDHEKDKADAVRLARAGASGMRCPGIPALRADSASPGAGVTPGPSQTQGTVLLPEYAGAILDAAGDSAQDVRDYNDLLDAYERLRQFANSPP